MDEAPDTPTMIDMTERTRSRPIVLGVEQSDRSRDALALARTLARATGARLIVASVYPIDPRRGGDVPGAYARALEAEAQAAVEWAVRPLGGVDDVELRTVPCRSVARGLQDLAEDEEALAIVVGPSDRGTLGRVVPGSAGQRLLAGSPCPVAIAPRGEWGNPTPGIRRIGLGYVAAPDGEGALRATMSLASRIGATVRILSVAEPTTATSALPVGWGYGALDAGTREALERDLRDAIASAHGTVPVTGDVVDGYADYELGRLSNEVDLLVCGSRGYGPVGSVLLGSVSSRVLEKARCPVLVVPRGTADALAGLHVPAMAAIVT